jgi:hypothetical protein
MRQAVLVVSNPILPGARNDIAGLENQGVSWPVDHVRVV